MGPKLATISLVLLTFFTDSLQSQYSSTSECPPYYNGSIAGSSCSREYSICVNGIRQAATCSDGYVFYEDGCVPIEDSPECQLADDTEEEPDDSFDCSSKQDGLYSIGCVNQFVNCVSGQAYQMYCPDDLVFHGTTQECQESCDDVEGDAATASPVVYRNEDDDEGYEEGSGETEGYYEPEVTTEEPIDFDCNGLENGNYADGCSDVFYTCNNGVVFRRYCPQGTVFNPSQQTCDYDCTEAVTTTTQAYVSTTDADVPSTTTSEYTTTPQDDEPEYTTSPGFDDVTTTQAPIVTAPTTTTQAPIVCHEGQITSFGMCSSRFNRCQNNSVRSKQCPVNTLFESALVLCVFDLPQCQPVTYPSNPTYNTYGEFPSDTIVSPFDENVRLKPKFDRRPKYHYGPYRQPGYGNQGYGNTLIENPFFVPRHHPYRHVGDVHRGRGHRRGYYRPTIDSPFSTALRGRAALDDQFKDYRRAKMGKLRYGEARKVEGNKRFILDDEFEGPKARFVQSDIQRIFPEDQHSKRKLGPREDPDGYKDDKNFDPKDLFGSTERRKRSVSYGTQQSGYGQQNTLTTARQAQVNKDCQPYTTPTFLTFGDCFDQFIYCSGDGVNRMAACPIGETFNKALRACSETCGVVTPVVTSTVGTPTSDDSSWSATTTGSSDDTFTTQAPSTYESYTTTQSWNDQPATTTQSWNDQPATTTASTPVGDRCSSVPSGLFSLGCSQKYIQCSNGAAIVRRCGGSLYFNQPQQQCSFRDEVTECGVQATTTYSPIVIAPAEDQTTDSYGSPSDDTPSTTRAPVGDRCAYVSSGLFAMGCSQKYIQCSNGAAIVRQCSANLYFNQATETCTFQDVIPECEWEIPEHRQDYISGESGFSSTSAPGQDDQTIGYGLSDDQPSTTSEYGSSTTSGYRSPYNPSEDIQSTTSGYNYEPSDDSSSTTTFGYKTSTQPAEDQPATYAPSIAPYRPSVSEDDQNKPEDACTGLSDGTHGQGCSSSFIVCSYGRLVNSITCPLGQGYDPSIQNCRTFSQIPSQACDQEETTTGIVTNQRAILNIYFTDAGLVRPLPYVTLEDVLSTTTQTSTTNVYDDDHSYETAPSDDSATTAAYGEETPGSDAPAQDETTVVVVTDFSNRADDDSEEEEDAGYEQKCTPGSRASTGFCVKNYLECTTTGYAEKSCRVGKLFDSNSNRCVARIACGKEAIRDAIKDVSHPSIVCFSMPMFSRSSPQLQLQQRRLMADVLMSKEKVFSLWEHAVATTFAALMVLPNLRTALESKSSPTPNQPVFSVKLLLSAVLHRMHLSRAITTTTNNRLTVTESRMVSTEIRRTAPQFFRYNLELNFIFLICFISVLRRRAVRACILPIKSRFQRVDRQMRLPTEGQRMRESRKNRGSVLRARSLHRRRHQLLSILSLCPSGTVFNPALSVCDWPSAVPSCGAAPPAGDDSSYGASSSYNDDNSGY
ncbi:Protein CBG08482 [Caenorhabditis briggsae]|uniref:Protein CBG08482 n=1 Tax=Caenorhabditis briggsae TaxID=6238 RepID=A8X6N7_CAEBR|nr:Protein CBG08482 [Caenorhabditis briggsae]CAP28298.2 Protein CBG08482 [Caenorhabditis briggsae]